MTIFLVDSGSPTPERPSAAEPIVLPSSDEEEAKWEEVPMEEASANGEYPMEDATNSSGGQEDEVPSARNMSNLFDDLEQREVISVEPVIASAIVATSTNVDLEMADWISKQLRKEIARSKRKLQGQIEKIKEKRGEKRKRVEEEDATNIRAESPMDPKIDAWFDDHREAAEQAEETLAGQEAPVEEMAEAEGADKEASAEVPKQSTEHSEHCDRSVAMEMFRWHIFRPLAEGQLAIARRLECISEYFRTNPECPAGREIFEELGRSVCMPNFGPFFPPPAYAPNLPPEDHAPNQPQPEPAANAESSPDSPVM